MMKKFLLKVIAAGAAADILYFNHPNNALVTVVLAIVLYEMFEQLLLRLFPARSYHGYTINATKADMRRVQNTRVGA